MYALYVGIKRWDPLQSSMGNWAGMSVPNEQASASWELMKCSAQNVSPPGTACASLLEFNPLPHRCLGSVFAESSLCKATGAAGRTKNTFDHQTGRNGVKFLGFAFIFIGFFIYLFFIKAYVTQKRQIISIHSVGCLFLIGKL